MAGFECSSHRRKDGVRLDLIRATSQSLHALGDYRGCAELGLRTIRATDCGGTLIETAPGTYDWSSWAPRGGPIGRCPGYLGHLRRGGVIFGHPRGWHTPPPSARRGRTGASARSVHGKPDALIALRHTASGSIRYERPPRDVGLAFCGFTSFAQLRLPQGDVAQVSFSQLAMAFSSLKFCLRTRSGS